MQYSQQLQQALQPAASQDTQSKMELGYNPQQALTFNQGSHQQMDFTQPINYNQKIPIAQENMQIEPYKSQPAEIEKYNPNIGKLPEVNKVFVLFVRHLPIMIVLKNYNSIERGFMMLFSIRLRGI